MRYHKNVWIFPCLLNPAWEGKGKLQSTIYSSTLSDIGENIKITNTGIGSILRNVCEGKVDAAVFVSSHVNSLLKDYIKSCGLKFIAYNNDTKSFHRYC